MTYSPCFFSPCWFPLCSPFRSHSTYLETLLAVTGSIHLGLWLLVNWPPHFPSLAHIPPTPKSRPPGGFSPPNIHSLGWLREPGSQDPVQFQTLYGGVMIHPKDVKSLSMSLGTIHPCGHNIPVSLCPMSKTSHVCPQSICPYFTYIVWDAMSRDKKYLGHKSIDQF
jgi:hypothetical protein